MGGDLLERRHGFRYRIDDGPSSRLPVGLFAEAAFNDRRSTPLAHCSPLEFLDLGVSHPNEGCDEDEASRPEVADLDLGRLCIEAVAPPSTAAVGAIDIDQTGHQAPGPTPARLQHRSGHCSELGTSLGCGHALEAAHASVELDERQVRGASCLGTALYVNRDERTRVTGPALESAFRVGNPLPDALPLPVAQPLFVRRNDVIGKYVHVSPRGPHDGPVAAGGQNLSCAFGEALAERPDQRRCERSTLEGVFVKAAIGHQ